MGESNYFNLFSNQHLDELASKKEDKTNDSGNMKTEEIISTQPEEKIQVEQTDAGNEAICMSNEELHRNDIDMTDPDSIQAAMPVDEKPKDNDNNICALQANINEIGGMLTAISEKINSMELHVSRLASYDTAVETLKRSLAANQTSENNLYKEVEAFKRGAYFTNIRPFLTFMIDMLCEMKKSRKQYVDEKEAFISEHGEDIFSEICGLLDFFISTFESQLTIQGVIITSYDPGEKYIAIYQHIAKTIATDDKNLNGVVAEVITDCYMYDKTVLKPAKVKVYKSVARAADLSD